MLQMSLIRREVVVAALIAVALVGVAAAEYENKKPAFYKAPAYVAKPKESSPTFYKAPAYVAKPKESSPAFYKAPAYVAKPKESSPTFYKAPAYVAKPKESNPDIQVQGGIFCKDYGKLSPLEGAMARLTCIAMGGKGGYESHPFSVVSKVTDSKGYYKINLSKYNVGPYKLSACKVFLETPPPGECSVSTDTNHGVSGASLPPTYRVLSDQTHLYSLPPFVYTKPAY